MFTFVSRGMSKFLVEGIMYNKPIVTTNVPGCKELVKNGKTVFCASQNTNYLK